MLECLVTQHLLLLIPKLNFFCSNKILNLLQKKIDTNHLFCEEKIHHSTHQNLPLFSLKSFSLFFSRISLKFPLHSQEFVQMCKRIFSLPHTCCLCVSLSLSPLSPLSLSSVSVLVALLFPLSTACLYPCHNSSKNL